jgi:hypothetical protein
MFTMKSEAVGWPSVVTDDLVHSTDQQICERQHLKISDLSSEFPPVSHTLLYMITRNTENGFNFDTFGVTLQI